MHPHTAAGHAHPVSGCRGTGAEGQRRYRRGRVGHNVAKPRWQASQETMASLADTECNALLLKAWQGMSICVGYAMGS